MQEISHFDWGPYMPSFIVIMLIVVLGKMLMPDFMSFFRKKVETLKPDSAGDQSVDYWKSEFKESMSETMNTSVVPVLEKLADTQREQSITQSNTVAILGRMENRLDKVAQEVHDSLTRADERRRMER